MSGKARLPMARVVAAVTSRRARLVTLPTLGLGLLAIGSNHGKGALSAIGFALIVLSLPSRGYALYLHSLHSKRSRNSTTLGPSNPHARRTNDSGPPPRL
jgi:hypothetical protein